MRNGAIGWSFRSRLWILPVQGNAVIDAKSPSAIPGDVEAA
jgi:hypothetical protein